MNETCPDQVDTVAAHIEDRAQVTPAADEGDEDILMMFVDLVTGP
ncbi:MAG: hypothetical protein U1E62_22535 [Alsobacter sp.]